MNDDSDDDCDENFHSENNKNDFIEVLKTFLISDYLGDVSEETLEVLYDSSTFIIKMIIQQSIKFMDKNNHTSMTLEDVKLGMKSKGAMPLLGFSIVNTDENGDEIIDLQNLVNESMVKVPLECSLKMECLAVSGVHSQLVECKRCHSGGIKSRKRKYRETVKVDKKLTSSLTEEESKYIDDVISSCMELDDDRRSAALDYLERDPILEPMLPNFINFIANSVKLNFIHSNIVRLVFLMRMCRSLLRNESLVWHDRLNDIIPPILTCVTHTNLIIDGGTERCSLRLYAASLLLHIVRNKYHPSKVIEDKICNLLSAALEDQRTPLGTQYGAILTLLLLSHEHPDVFINFLLPHISKIGHKIIPILEDSTADSWQTKAETNMARTIRMRLLASIPDVIRGLENPPVTLNDFKNEFGPYFGPLLYRVITKNQTTQSNPSSKTHPNRVVLSPLNVALKSNFSCIDHTPPAIVFL